MLTEEQIKKLFQNVAQSNRLIKSQWEDVYHDMWLDLLENPPVVINERTVKGVAQKVIKRFIRAEQRQIATARKIEHNKDVEE